MVTLSRGGALVRARNGLRATGLLDNGTSETRHPGCSRRTRFPQGHERRGGLGFSVVMHANGVLIMSVCTGALILGRAGLLMGYGDHTPHRSWGIAPRRAANDHRRQGPFCR